MGGVVIPEILNIYLVFLNIYPHGLNLNPFQNFNLFLKYKYIEEMFLTCENKRAWVHGKSSYNEIFHNDWKHCINLYSKITYTIISGISLRLLLQRCLLLLRWIPKNSYNKNALKQSKTNKNKIKNIIQIYWLSVICIRPFKKPIYNGFTMSICKHFHIIAYNTYNFHLILIKLGNQKFIRISYDTSYICKIRPSGHHKRALAGTVWSKALRFKN